MPNQGHPVAVTVPKKEKEESIEKQGLKIRCSLFFDGTKNNKFNIEEREKSEMGKKSDSDAYKKNGDGAANSYDNGRTNIAILEPNTLKEQTGYDFSFKIYIEGQGTLKLVADDTKGYALGSGDTGVFQRAKEGANELIKQLRLYLRKKPPEKFIIEKLDIDVFGFSRGAATARQCISMLLTNEGAHRSNPAYPMFMRIRLDGYKEIAAKNVEVKFAGLFDTVLSVNASQLNWFTDDLRCQRAVALATKSVHLAAADEHRVDFPLHKITSAISAGKGEEYYLPGVHSDVGGSYNQANLLQQNTKTLRIVLKEGDYEDIKAEQAARPKELDYEITARVGRGVASKAKLIELRTINTKDKDMRTTNEVDMVVNYADIPSLMLDKSRLIKHGWYKPEEISIEPTLLVEGALVVTRRNIKTAYSNIPLKLMAEFAEKSGLKFDAKLQQRADITLQKEPDLIALEKSIKSYVGSKGSSGSKPEDWLEDAKKYHAHPVHSLENIRHDHLHMSAQATRIVFIKFGFTPRFTLITQKRRRYYYEG